MPDPVPPTDPKPAPVLKKCPMDDGPLTPIGPGVWKCGTCNPVTIVNARGEAKERDLGAEVDRLTLRVGAHDSMIAEAKTTIRGAMKNVPPFLLAGMKLPAFLTDDDDAPAEG